MRDTLSSMWLRGYAFEAARFDEVYAILLERRGMRPPAVNPAPRQSRYITLDGIGGSGKDTLLTRLERKGVRTIKEDVYELFHLDVRNYWRDGTTGYNPAIPAYLIATGKYAVNCTVLPALLSAAGTLVTNRSFLSTIALSATELVDMDEMLQVYARFPVRPDLRIVLDCDPTVAYRRKLASNAIGRSDTPEFLLRSRPYFIDAAKRLHATVIDTTTKTPDEVENEFWKVAGTA